MAEFLQPSPTGTRGGAFIAKNKKSKLTMTA
jgi:hypothetical protein